jgi:curved DNA-binding protein CbpA
MNPSSQADPFSALGLPARPDITGDEVHAAWRRIAAATHPDRADGGDPARFAAAAAAYTALRTPFGRGEALADLAERPGHGGRRGLRRVPGDRGPADPAAQPQTAAMKRPTAADAGQPTAADAGRLTAADAGRPTAADAGRPAPAAAGSGRSTAAARLLSRARRGRPARLALRLAIVGAVSATAIAVAGTAPATPALITGAVTWLLLTARHDLAPPG